MKSNLQAFDAMTVMVQYLSQDVGGLKVKPAHYVLWNPACYDSHVQVSKLNTYYIHVLFSVDFIIILN